MIIIVYLILYLLSSFIMYKIYQKANLSDAWMAWIPILSVIPYFHVIDRSAWNFFYLIIPIANIYFIIRFTIDFLKAYGLNPWWVIGYFISPINLIILLYIAFSQNVAYQLNNNRFN